MLEDDQLLTYESIIIVFFTDGEDFGGDATTKQSAILKAFFNEQKFKDKGISTEVHTIGFTENHDLELLSKFTLLGNAEGTFQYAKDSTILGDCIQNLSFISNSKISCTLTI